MRIPRRYQNIVNRINIFQLAGNAKHPEATLRQNINRISTFYADNFPDLTKYELSTLERLLYKFYMTANFYHARGTYHEFIVSDFSMIHNNEWVTVEQFINYLQALTDMPILSRTIQHVINALIIYSHELDHAYYPHHLHTTVGRQAFDRTIKQDFEQK